MRLKWMAEILEAAAKAGKHGGKEDEEEEGARPRRARKPTNPSRESTAFSKIGNPVVFPIPLPSWRRYSVLTGRRISRTCILLLVGLY